MVRRLPRGVGRSPTARPSRRSISRRSTVLASWVCCWRRRRRPRAPRALRRTAVAPRGEWQAARGKGA
eukprot:8904088-Alexandrium_andersonii.AAC.1